MSEMKYNFSEPAALTDVSQFHHVFQLPVLDYPSIPAESRCNLRINLLSEELDELKTAIHNNDLVGIADALCDLQYVLSGAVLEFGMGAHFKALFDEVQASNMSKVCRSYEEAEKTQKYYTQRDGTESYIVKKDHGYLVYRTTDGKVLKSINYQPPNLVSVLNEL